MLQTNDGVSVLALTPRDEVVLVRQFRPGCHRDCLECPGGLVDLGEDPTFAGIRELREETGYVGGHTESLGLVYGNPALLTMKTHLVVVHDVEPTGHRQLDSGEEIVVEVVPRNEIPKLITDGEIVHATSIACLLLWNKQL